MMRPSLLDQHGDALLALGTPKGPTPTAVVITVDGHGNLTLEQRLPPGDQLDPNNPAHRVANWLVANAQHILGPAFDAPMKTAMQRVVTLN